MTQSNIVSAVKKSSNVFEMETVSIKSLEELFLRHRLKLFPYTRVSWIRKVGHWPSYRAVRLPT